jgi:hypothetical protein
MTLGSFEMSSSCFGVVTSQSCPDFAVSVHQTISSRQLGVESSSFQRTFVSSMSQGSLSTVVLSFLGMFALGSAERSRTLACDTVGTGVAGSSFGMNTCSSEVKRSGTVMSGSSPVICSSSSAVSGSNLQVSTSRLEGSSFCFGGFT